MSGSLDRAVVVDDVELGLSLLGEHHLVGAGDAHDPAGDVEVHRVTVRSPPHGSISGYGTTG